MNLSRSIQSSYGLKTKFLMAATALMLALSALVALAPSAVEAQTSTAIALSKTAYRFGEPLYVSGRGFAAGEKISLWFTTPSGRADDAEGGNGTYVNASAAGTFDNFPVGGGNSDANNIVILNGPGTWYLTAKGNKSGATATTTFTVVAPLVVAQGVQVGSVLFVFFVGGGFYPNEKNHAVAHRWYGRSFGSALHLR